MKGYEIVGLCTLCAISGILIGRPRKRAVNGESFLVRIFKDNKDFDSTLDRVLLAGIILFMLMAFHDDLTNVQTAGIVLALFNSLFAVYQSVVTGKVVADGVRNAASGRLAGSQATAVADAGQHGRDDLPTALDKGKDSHGKAPPGKNP